MKELPDNVIIWITEKMESINVCPYYKKINFYKVWILSYCFMIFLGPSHYILYIFKDKAFRKQNLNQNPKLSLEFHHSSKNCLVWFMIYGFLWPLT